MARLTGKARTKLPGGDFAFVAQRKEPLENATHVRSAIARFGQVTGVSDAERDLAWERIRAAADTFGVQMTGRHWRHPTH